MEKQNKSSLKEKSLALIKHKFSALASGGITDTGILQLIAHTIYREAQIMAYNDIGYIFSWMFLVTLPFLLLLPSKKNLHKLRTAHLAEQGN